VKNREYPFTARGICGKKIQSFGTVTSRNLGLHTRKKTKKREGKITKKREIGIEDKDNPDCEMKGKSVKNTYGL